MKLPEVTTTKDITLKVNTAILMGRVTVQDELELPYALEMLAHRLREDEGILDHLDIFDEGKGMVLEFHYKVYA